MPTGIFLKRIEEVKIFERLPLSAIETHITENRIFTAQARILCSGRRSLEDFLKAGGQLTISDRDIHSFTP